MKLEIGLNEVEDYNADLNLKLKSQAFKDRGPLANRDVVRVAMRKKLMDEVRVVGECTRARDKTRREIKQKFGEKSNTTKAIFKQLRINASNIRVNLRAKYKCKLAHLKKKFAKKVELAVKPVNLDEYNSAKVFDKKEFDGITPSEIQVSIVGNLVLSEEVKSVLRLHPKFAIREKIEDEELDFQQELGYAKLRYQLNREEEEDLGSEDEMEEATEEEREQEKDKQEEEEARSRQFFDPEGKVFNYGKKRATDLKENARVTLPKPSNASNEAGIEMRRKTFSRVVEEFKAEECNKKMEQQPNMTKSEISGLKSLQKMIKAGEIIVMRTDKSSKLAITDLETYIEMGSKHTNKDEVITMEEVTEREKIVNGHTSMYIKMTGMGKVWGHEPRMRASKITRSKNLASMFLQLKDHKAKLDSRAIVTANSSNTVGLSNICSELMESIADAVNSPTEVNSSEDMLSRIHQCNKDLETLKKQKEERGEKLTQDEMDIYLLGADVIALFPSMTSQRTGKIVRDQATASPIQFEGLNYREMARYAAVCEHLTSGVDEVRRLLPRRSKEGAKATGITMKNKEINGKDSDTEIEWTFPACTPTEKEKQILVGIMLEIGTRVLWENFCYSFAGKIYLQKSGGPIGARVTMAASRLVMYQWGATYTQILIRSNLNLRLFGVYVDDVRQGTNLIPRGYKFEVEENKFMYKLEWEQEDDRENLTNLKRMGNRCLEAMNSINPDLRFTVESEEDFENGRIQTLDFEEWSNPDGTVSHSFFEKAMQTPLVTMERTAMAAQQKHAILANDLVRRLTMIKEDVATEEKIEVVDKFTKKLKTSGYNQNQCTELVTSGVKGFKNKVKNRKKNGQPLYRNAKSTLKGRIKKKLVEKTSWYKQKKKLLAL